MKVYSAMLLTDEGAWNVRYLLHPEELEGLQAVGLVPMNAAEVVGMQNVADMAVCKLEKQFYTATGGKIQ